MPFNKTLHAMPCHLTVLNRNLYFLFFTGYPIFKYIPKPTIWYKLGGKSLQRVEYLLNELLPPYPSHCSITLSTDSDCSDGVGGEGSPCCAYFLLRFRGSLDWTLEGMSTKAQEGMRSMCSWSSSSAPTWLRSTTGDTIKMVHETCGIIVDSSTHVAHYMRFTRDVADNHLI